MSLRIRDKLSLSQPVIEKAVFYYRKTLVLNDWKGRSMNGFGCSLCVYCMQERRDGESVEEISKSIDTDEISLANVTGFYHGD